MWRGLCAGAGNLFGFFHLAILSLFEYATEELALWVGRTLLGKYLLHLRSYSSFP